jgi:FAD/FMN-containing dehydrogenase
MIEHVDYSEIVDELKEAIGSEYVSDKAAVLNCYSRDMTPVASGRPQVVVMPGSTEDVQAVVKIADKYETPVVPFSTGFNIGGLTICQRGGLLVDLRRMRKLEIDEESMTVTVGPAVQCRTIYFELKKIKTFYGLPLRVPLSLSLGSTSVIGNYVSNGGSGWAGKYGANITLITSMKWVMPDGEILVTGAGAIPNSGSIGVSGGPGPDISGMLLNANGTMGICTEITIKAFPDKPFERAYMASSFDTDDDAACEQIIDLYYEIAQSNIQDVTYKNHPGITAQMTGCFANDDPLDLVDLQPKHPLAMIIQGLTEEEMLLKMEVFKEMCERRGMAFADPTDLGFGALVNMDNMKGTLGVDGNVVCAYKGSFNFSAFLTKMEYVPQIWKEWKEISRRFWSLKHERPYEETLMCGFNLQGPMVFGRFTPFEIDWWWDHGDPEDIKKAAMIVRKFNEFALKWGGPLFRNNGGAGEIVLPHWGIYFDLLKQTKDLIDPKNIMNPDVLPIGKDYIQIVNYKIDKTA